MLESITAWRVFSVLLGFLALGAELALFLVLRAANRLYADDGVWRLAEYAEPARSACFVLLVTLTAWLTLRAAGAGTWKATFGMLALVLAGPAFTCELGMALFFHPITGEFRITALAFSRVEFDLPINESGPCFFSDMRGLFHWSLDVHRFAPRLLPLPLASEKLESALRCPWIVR